VTHDIETFRAMLPVDKHRLDDALEVHAQAQERISARVARENSHALLRKRELEAEEARVIYQLKVDDPKMTNPIAEKEAKRNSSYLKAWHLYQQARQEHEEWAGLLSAWQARGYNLKALGDLYGMQYFAVDSTRARARVEEAVNRYRGEAQQEPSALPRRRRTTG